MNPREVWEVEEGGGHRLILSPATYNASGIGRVISVPIGGPPDDFDPFAVETRAGHVYVDKLLQHPRDWLIKPLYRVSDDEYDAIRKHLRFLFGL